MHYDDYIRERAEQAFDYDEAKFALYDQDHEEMEECLDDDLNREMFKGVMCEMVSHLYELRNDSDGGMNIKMLWDSENVENVYVTARGLGTAVVIVEYDETPEWFSIHNAELREFYWHPKPALSGEWDAAYFQAR